jgi:hypothetical protein
VRFAKAANIKSFAGKIKLRSLLKGKTGTVEFGEFQPLFQGVIL